MAQSAPPHPKVGEVPCIHCSTVIEVAQDFATAYCAGIQPPCPACGIPVNWWDTLLQAFLHDFPGLVSLPAVGATNTFFQIAVQPYQYQDIAFTDYGVPQDAHILDVFLTPYSPVTLYQSVGGSNRLARHHVLQSSIRLYTVPWGEGTGEPGSVQVAVTWVQNANSGEARKSLIDAAQNFSIGDFESAIIPANNAVELAITRLIEEFLTRVEAARHDKSYVRNFLINNATYSYQLNILLPTILTLKELPSFPLALRSEISTLTKIRNDVAHGGKTSRPLNKQITGRLICAALFGMSHVNYIAPRLLGRPGPRQDNP